MDSSILAAAERWGGEPDIFERYLRIFHGVTKVQWHETSNYTYTLQVWEPVDSCGGYYGFDYVVEAANEALEDYAANEVNA